jgi:hypothetical protein
MLETHLAGRTTKKSQNSNTSELPACTQLPHAMIYRGTRRPSALLGRYRPTGEQISGMQYSHSHPWDKPA